MMRTVKFKDIAEYVEREKKNHSTNYGRRTKTSHIYQ